MGKLNLNHASMRSLLTNKSAAELLRILFLQFVVSERKRCHDQINGKMCFQLLTITIRKNREYWPQVGGSKHKYFTTDNTFLQEIYKLLPPSLADPWFGQDMSTITNCVLSVITPSKWDGYEVTHSFVNHCYCWHQLLTYRLNSKNHGV